MFEVFLAFSQLMVVLCLLAMRSVFHYLAVSLYVVWVAASRMLNIPFAHIMRFLTWMTGRSLDSSWCSGRELVDPRHMSLFASLSQFVVRVVANALSLLLRTARHIVSLPVWLGWIAIRQVVVLAVHIMVSGVLLALKLILGIATLPLRLIYIPFRPLQHDRSVQTSQASTLSPLGMLSPSQFLDIMAVVSLLLLLAWAWTVRMRIATFITRTTRRIPPRFRQWRIWIVARRRPWNSWYRQATVFYARILPFRLVVTNFKNSCVAAAMSCWQFGIRHGIVPTGPILRDAVPDAAPQLALGPTQMISPDEIVVAECNALGVITYVNGGPKTTRVKRDLFSPLEMSVLSRGRRVVIVGSRPSQPPPPAPQNGIVLRPASYRLMYDPTANPREVAQIMAINIRVRLGGRFVVDDHSHRLLASRMLRELCDAWRDAHPTTRSFDLDRVYSEAFELTFVPTTAEVQAYETIALSAERANRLAELERLAWMLKPRSRWAVVAAAQWVLDLFRLRGRVLVGETRPN